MGFEVILVLGAIAFLICSLYLNWLRPAITFFVTITALVFCSSVFELNILTTNNILHAFANEQLAIIVLLLLFGEILRKSYLLPYLFGKALPTNISTKHFLIRMTSIVSMASAFFNNTPLVAIMMPYVRMWSQKKNIAASKLLMPLSYAAILGGCVTLIGTSTNMMVNGMAIEAGFPSLKVFDFVIAGFPMLIIGAIYLMFFYNKLLPDNKGVTEFFMDSSLAYLMEAKVPQDSHLVGKTVEEANLRNLKALYLVQIIRDDADIKPVSPAEVLQAGDNLIFTGNTSAVEGLRYQQLGLSLPKACHFEPEEYTQIRETVITPGSRLSGLSVKDASFRGRFDAAILAIHREGSQLGEKIGDVVLKEGDVLLILAGRDFDQRITNNNDLSPLTTGEKEDNQISPWKFVLLFGGIIASVFLSTWEVVPLFISLLVLLAIVLLAKVVPVNELRKGFDYNLAIILGLGLALGKAMINSGTADLLADLIQKTLGAAGPLGILFALFLFTNITAAYVTNKAAAAILFPVSISIATSLGFPPKPFILIVAFGAAANFITPIGYQTNLMVYGAGGYSFKDYMRFGLPLTILYAIVCSSILYFTMV